MPSTYTLNNGIELISTGEQSGTWGDTTNTNLSLLDTALDGQVTVTLASAGTSGSPNALAIADGSASDGRNRMVIFNDGGDLGATAYVQLTPNDAEKIIYVRNDLAGSRSIILFQGTYNASNDYEVPAGTTAIIYFDGAGSGAVAANVFNNAYFDSLRLGGVSVTAIIDDDSMGTASATNIATSESIKAYVDAQVGANNELSEVLANGNTTGGTDISVSSGDDITFADSSKAIFGAGSDLQIYHDGSHSRIDEQGTGVLFLQTNGTNIQLNKGTSENMLVANVDGSVDLYYDNAKKLATTSTGVDITGSGVFSNSTDVAQSFAEFGRTPFSTHGSFLVSGTGTGHLTSNTDASGNSTVGVGATRVALGNGELDFYKSGNTAAGSPRTFSRTMGIASNNDITFYDTLGNASFVYDESAGLVINQQGDAKDFRVESDGYNDMLFVDGANNRVSIATASGYKLFNVGGSMAVGGSGNQGILFGSGVVSTADQEWFLANNQSDNNSLQLYEYNGGVFVKTRMIVESGGDFRIQSQASGDVIINEDGENSNFRVESDGQTHMLFVDASTNRVGINNNAPQAFLHVNSADGSGAFRVEQTNPSAGGNSWYALFEDDSNADQGSFNSFVYINSNRLNTSTGKVLKVVGNGKSSEYFSIYDTGVVTVNESSLSTADFRVESDTNTHALFVDAGNDHVNIGTSTDYGSTLNVFTTGTDALEIVSDNGNANAGPYLDITRKSSSPADGDLTGAIRFLANNDTAETLVASINTVFDDVSNASEDSSLFFKIRQAGAQPNVLDFSPTETIVNNDSFNRDFRVESDSNTHALFVDAGAEGGQGAVGIGTSTPQRKFIVSEQGANGIEIDPNISGISEIISYNRSTSQYTDLNIAASSIELAASGAVIVNQSGNDADFRVESDTNSNALTVDASTNVVGILSNTGNSFYNGALQGPSWAITNLLGVDQTGFATGAYQDAYGSTTGWKFKGSYGAALTTQVDSGHGFYTTTSGNGAGNPITWAPQLNLHKSNGAVFNEDGIDLDFRVESDSNANMLFVDASASMVYVGATSFVVGTDSLALDTGRIRANKNADWTFESSGTNGNHCRFFGTGGAAAGSITTTATTTAYNTSSDYRLKENVVAMTGATTRLKQLEPKRFNFIADEDDTIVDGFIAHEVQSVVPEAITGTHNEVDADGNPVYQGIDQSKLVPLLVATIKELEARITALENA